MLPQLRPHVRPLLLLGVLTIAAIVEVSLEPSFVLLPPGRHLEAFVANSGDGTITAVDLVSLNPVRVFNMGGEVTDLQVVPKKTEIWGICRSRNTLWVFHPPSGQLRELKLGFKPSALNLLPDGRIVLVAGAEGRVEAVDAATLRVMKETRIDLKPTDAVLTPDGKQWLVLDGYRGELALLSPVSLNLQVTLELNSGASGTVVVPDGSKAYMASTTDDSILSIRLHPPAVLARVHTGGRQDRLLLKPDGGELYAFSSQLHGVTVLNTQTDEVVDFWLLGAAPVAAAISSDGAMLYVCDRSASRVTVLDTAYRENRGSAPTGKTPVDCALDPGGHLLLAADRDSNDLAVIDLRGPRLLTLVPTGMQPAQVVALQF